MYSLKPLLQESNISEDMKEALEKNWKNFSDEEKTNIEKILRKNIFRTKNIFKRAEIQVNMALSEFKEKLKQEKEKKR
jgi:hypothetical protein